MSNNTLLLSLCLSYNNHWSSKSNAIQNIESTHTELDESQDVALYNLGFILYSNIQNRGMLDASTVDNSSDRASGTSNTEVQGKMLRCRTTLSRSLTSIIHIL